MSAPPAGSGRPVAGDPLVRDEPPAPRGPSNEDVAVLFEDVADVLEAQEANPHRVRAYRAGAASVRSLPRPVAAICAEGGRAALEDLPAIGATLASAIEEIVHTGRLAMYERLLGATAPEDLFTVVPGIGEALARRIHDALGLETLEDLEAAAHDGRLERVLGIGPRRVRAIREVLASTLSRSSRRRSRRVPGAVAGGTARGAAPPVSTLLAVDARYRREAEAGTLRRIAPRRFNPAHEAWLPVLHAEQDGWSVTAMFSNTALAHRLGRTHDWVVLYPERDGEEAQFTVVTEVRGPLAGRRVVRGREGECEAHDAADTANADRPARPAESHAPEGEPGAAPLELRRGTGSGGGNAV